MNKANSTRAKLFSHSINRDHLTSPPRSGIDHALPADRRIVAVSSRRSGVGLGHDGGGSALLGIRNGRLCSDGLTVSTALALRPVK